MGYLESQVAQNDGSILYPKAAQNSQKVAHSGSLAFQVLRFM